MDIRQKNTDQMNVSATEIRSTARNGIRTVKRAGHVSVSAGKFLARTGKQAAVRRMIRRGEFRTKTYLMSERSELEQDAIAGMSKKQRKAWKRMSKAEQRRMLNKVAKKTDRKMMREFRNEKMGHKASGQAEQYRKNQETFKRRQGTAGLPDAGRISGFQKKRYHVAPKARMGKKGTVNQMMAAGRKMTAAEIIKIRNKRKQRKGMRVMPDSRKEPGYRIARNDSTGFIPGSPNVPNFPPDSTGRYFPSPRIRQARIHPLQKLQAMQQYGNKISGSAVLPVETGNIRIQDGKAVQKLKQKRLDGRNRGDIPDVLTHQARQQNHSAGFLPAPRIKQAQIHHLQKTQTAQRYGKKPPSEAIPEKTKVSGNNRGIPKTPARETAASETVTPYIKLAEVHFSGNSKELRGMIRKQDILLQKQLRVETGRRIKEGKEYQKQFGKKLKQFDKKYQKTYRKEFMRIAQNELRSVAGKQEAQKEAEKEMTIGQLQDQQTKWAMGIAFMPVKIAVRMAVAKILAGIAAVAAAVVSTLLSLLLPLIGFLLCFALIINLVISIINFVLDDSSAGLPDAAYVTKEAVIWAAYIAENDEKHGYNDGFFSRWGPSDFSNCTFVVTAFDKTGLELKRAGAKKISEMYDAFLGTGFLDVTEEVTLSTGKGLEAGDVLVKVSSDASECRAGIIDQDGKIISAVCDERGKQKGGQKGDQTGEEIRIEKYSNPGWTYVLRYYGDMALFGGLGQELAEYACGFIGLPYVWGGTSLVTGADCSGFVGAVYAHFGYTLPRTAGNIYSYSRKLSSDQSTWQPGDIIYYSYTGTVQTGGGNLEHIGIYIGNGKVVQCGNGGVQIRDVNYNGAFYGAGRILPDYDPSVNLAGNNNSQKIWNYLRKTLGCSRAAAAGIIGNMYAEGTLFDPNAVESNGVGHGICQWSWDRWYGANGLAAFANRNNRNWNDLALQLAFLRYEIENNIVGGINYCIPGGWQKYKTLVQVSGSGGTVHLWFNAYEYNGGTFSYDYLMTQGEKNWAFASRRLWFAEQCYRDTANYP